MIINNDLLEDIIKNLYQYMIPNFLLSKDVSLEEVSNCYIYINKSYLLKNIKCVDVSFRRHNSSIKKSFSIKKYNISKFTLEISKQMGILWWIKYFQNNKPILSIEIDNVVEFIKNVDEEYEKYICNVLQNVILNKNLQNHILYFLRI